MEKSGLRLGLAGDAIVDELAQLPLELRHQRRPLAPERSARVEEHLLFFAHVGLARAIHQQVADPIQNLRERGRQALDRQVPALVEDPRDLRARAGAVRRLGGSGVALT